MACYRRFVAKTTIVQTVDDLTGSILEDPVTVRWSLDGRDYEFDTTEKNAAQFRSLIETYRAVSRPSRVATAQPPRHQKKNRAGIFDWAREQGFQIGNSGRVPTEVRDAWDRAHP